MKRLLIILVLFYSLLSFGQTDTTYYADSLYTFNDGAGGNMVIVDVAEPDTVAVLRNRIETNRTYGLGYMVGRDSYDEDAGNVNQSIVAGNSIICSDYNNGVHGGMNGYALIGWKHNYFGNCGYSVVTEGVDSTVHNGDLPIMYNIFKSPGYYGTTCEGQRNTQYYNNTYFAGRSMVGYLAHFANNTPPDAPGTVVSDSADFFNNILYSIYDSVFVFVGEDCKTTFESDYNLYWCENSVDNEPWFYVQGEASNPISFSQWQALGYGEHSVVANPNFIDTIDFIPAARLDYGNALGILYNSGLDTSYSFVAKSYPETTTQNGTWQVGAVIYAEISSIGGDYYVSPTGSDNDLGTLAEPWLTPQKAFETAEAGDTVWFRGGTYSPLDYETGHDIYSYDAANGVGNSGTYGNPICYYNYPGENPIIDFSNISASTSNIGIYMDSVHYVRFRGLTFQNLPKAATGPNAMTIDAHACSNLHFDRIIIQDGGGAAIRYFSGMGDDVGIYTDSTYVINCDFINNADSSGNHADGLKFDQDIGAYFYFYGNRALFNTDDGFDVSGSALRVFVNNWAFGNGNVPNGNGNGFKTAGPRDTLDYPSIIFINNLAAFNRSPDDDGGTGFGIPDYQVTDSSYRRGNARFYNNTSYKNDLGFIEFANPLWSFRNCEYRNNIAYDNYLTQDEITLNVQILTYPYPESHNTWDYQSGGYSFVETDTVTVTDADFVLTDSTLAAAEVSAARNSDGSLPTITFMTLVGGSDLIDAGTTYKYSEIADVPGVPAISTTPDIGYAQYSAVATSTVRPLRSSGGKFIVSIRGNLIKQ